VGAVVPLHTVGRADFCDSTASTRFFLPSSTRRRTRSQPLQHLRRATSSLSTGSPAMRCPERTTELRRPVAPAGLWRRGSRCDSGSFDTKFKAVNNLECGSWARHCSYPTSSGPGRLSRRRLLRQGRRAGSQSWDSWLRRARGCSRPVRLRLQLTGYLHYRLVGVNANGSALTPLLG